MSVLIEARREKGWSRVWVAKKLGVTKQYLWMIETGKRKPSATLLRMIHEMYGVPYEQILAVADTPAALGSTVEELFGSLREDSPARGEERSE
jgi:transcriptional regulator with XRE-family HTH domain